MIKNYLELNKFEVEKLIQFINRNKTNKLSYEDIDKQFKSDEFDLALIKVVRGKGYEKLLLETAISFSSIIRI
ncbi:hypothetical protein [Alkaliphilus sp. B6464]|uniref:hypothetical protein n=1 Tax=Alkaliphilus sp. B6464 TaxID=2731219 RepID=UPI001BA5F87E|nr:hypothetical protein [Alkaliphilus sp. B6464]QUH19256.1 hypothetical protein HYG84_04680 [Alkaliphilus sp. B6464]